MTLLRRHCDRAEVMRAGNSFAKSARRVAASATAPGGAIATYNPRGKIEGPRNYRNLIPRRGRMEGFIILDYVGRFPEAQAEMAGWVAQGKVKFATHLVDGLEQAPAALNLLFTRGNTGKVIVLVE